MTSITNNQGASMQAPTPSIAAPPMPRMRLSLAALNWRMGILRLIALSNGIILLTLLWMIVVPDAPLGLLAPLFEDMARLFPQESALNLRFALVAAFGFLVFADVSQSLRRLPPSYGALFSLSGQFAIALMTTAYVLTGRLPLLALYGVWGSALLSAVMIIAVTQSYAGTTRYNVRRLLYPVLSALMGGLGMALILSPDTATRDLIEQRYGLLALGVLLASLAWGCGQLRLNHLSPKEMIVRLAGLVFYSSLSFRLLEAGQVASLLGLFLSVNVAALGIFAAFAQAEIERLERDTREGAK